MIVGKDLTVEIDGLPPLKIKSFLKDEDKLRVHSTNEFGVEVKDQESLEDFLLRESTKRAAKISARDFIK